MVVFGGKSASHCPLGILLRVHGFVCVAVCFCAVYSTVDAADIRQAISGALDGLGPSVFGYSVVCDAWKRAARKAVHDKADYKRADSVVYHTGLI